MAHFSATHSVWFSDKKMFDEAEARYYGQKPCAQVHCAEKEIKEQPLTQQIASIRDNIRNACDRVPCLTTAIVPSAATASSDQENIQLRQLVMKMEATVLSVQARLDVLEAQLKNVTLGSPLEEVVVEDKKVVVEEEEDDDVDLFGSDDEEEDAEAARIREERLKAYAEKKSKKVGPIAKSSILLDVKPWSDETDLKLMEEEIRQISMEGLTWCAGKTVPLAFGIHKLQILCIVVDDLVMMDDLTEKIEALEEHVQSVDIAAFNKI